MAQSASVSLKVLLTIAWPVIVSRSTQVVLGVGDAVMVSHLGETGVAATTTGAMNVFSLLVFPIGIAFIVSSYASQLFGAEDRPGARRYGVYGLGLAALTQLVCMAAIPLVPLVLAPLPYTPELREGIHTYMGLRLLSGGAAIGVEALANYYGGIGNTRLPMIINLVTMGFDLVANYMLIGGHWGAPAMGVAGAALSSSLSSWLFFTVFLVIFLKDGRHPREGGRRWPAALSLREFRRMLRFGLPSGVNWFLESFAFVAFINIVLADLGTTTLAAFMAVMQANSVSFMPALGLSSAGAILVGQSIGAGRPEDVPRIVHLTWRVAAGWQGFVSLLYLAIPTTLLGAFANEEARAAGFLVIGARMLRLSAAWQLFDATVSALSEALRAAGDTDFPMWCRVGLAWLFFIPGALVLVRVFDLGDVAAVGWMVVYMGLLAGAMVWRFHSGAWRRIQLVESPPLP